MPLIGPAPWATANARLFMRRRLMVCCLSVMFFGERLTKLQPVAVGDQRFWRHSGDICAPVGLSSWAALGPAAGVGSPHSAINAVLVAASCAPTVDNAQAVPQLSDDHACYAWV